MADNGKSSHSHCKKENEIGKNRADLETLKKIVMGNGQEGLSVSVPKLSENVKSLERSITGLKPKIGELLEFKNETLGVVRGKAVIQKRNKALTTTLISILRLLLVVIGILIGKLT